MTSNMLLEDVLAILGPCGTLELRKGTWDASATPSHTADRKGWRCQLTMPGYLTTNGTRHTLDKRAPTATEAAAAVLADLESFLASPRAVQARKRYLESHALQVYRSGKRPAHIQPWEWHPCAPPGQPYPEVAINYGD